MTAQTVMLVEDEPDIREMLTFALTRAGFNTIGAASAEDAMRLLDGPLPAVRHHRLDVAGRQRHRSRKATAPR